MTKRDSFYQKINKNLGWREIISFNVLVFLVVILPLSIRLVKQQNLDTGSSAAIEAPSPTPLPHYPQEKPQIERVKLFFGRPGDGVIIMGKNFGDYMWDKSYLWIGGIKVDKKDVIKWSDKIIEVQIPQTAKSGRISMSINGKTTMWSGWLEVIDSDVKTRVGLRKIAQQQGEFFVKGNQISKGVVVLGYEGGNLQVKGKKGVSIVTSQTMMDSFGKKMEVQFIVNEGVKEGGLLVFEGERGQVELLEGRFYKNNILVDVYAILPEVKITF